MNMVLYDGYDAALEAGRDPSIEWNNVQLLMEAAITETDPGIREPYYARIQQLLVEEDMPMVYGAVRFYEAWYNSEIQGFQMNSLRKLNFFGVLGVEEPDTTLPVTEIFLSGMEGMNGWYTSDVIVTLNATDDDSGVLGIGYGFGGEPIIYTGPFLIEETTTFGYGSVDFAGNFGATSMITIEIYKTPSVITDKIIKILEDLDVPPGAQKEVDKALYDLQAALRKFDRGWFYVGIQRIFKAFKHLMDAQGDGADVFSIGFVLVGMVMNMVDNAINDAIELVGEDNKFIMKAQEFYNDALIKLSEGKYDQAINSFKHAYKFAMKAKIRGILYQIWMYFCG